jgi:hypothetical protein
VSDVKSYKYSPKVRERAIRLLEDYRHEYEPDAIA